MVAAFLIVVPCTEGATNHAQVSPVSPPGKGGALSLQAYTFRYQVAREALPLVYPLLSVHGTVELQPEANTLVVRDQPGALRRILSVLSAFDHPPRPVRLELQMIEAGPHGVSPPASRALDPKLVRQLHELLRFDSYRVVAQTTLHTREGESVSYDLGPLYRVHFRLGAAIEKRLKLKGFTIARGAKKKGAKLRPLVHADLNLWLSEPLILGLTQDESSKHALMVVVKGQLEVRKP
ncbi:MAG TPA: hypothetical protein VKA63_12235 [Candidatus Krumholzibacteria bacterium]|nr:hypothetical protein [Candidatus Krumholzibacteria bacterium]